MAGHQYFQVDVYSHHFVLSRVQVRGQEVIESFARQYVQFGLVKEGRRFVRAPVKVFAVRVRGSQGSVMEYRFHIQQFDAFIKHLTNMQILPHTYEIIRHDPHPGAEEVLNVLEHWTPKIEQVPIIDYLVSEKPSRSKLVEVQTGSGKAQPLDSLVRVPGGWEFMGNIKVGDKVIAKDGSTTTVNGVYPQGKKQIYKITFADGRTAECCAEHLWRVYYINTVPNRRWKIVNTIEMIRLISMPNPRVYIDLIDPEDDEDMELEMDPYLLGLFLGDGHLGFNTVRFSKSDQEILDTICKHLPSSVKMVKRNDNDHAIVMADRKVENGKNAFLEIFRKFGLSGKLSNEKFIPEHYLNASRQQRLALLQGLLDTDGTVDKNGSVSYSTTSSKLAEEVQYLVRSLGGIATIGSRIPGYTYNSEKRLGRRCYNVSIRYKKPSELFRLTRKKIRTNDQNQYASDLKLRVIRIEAIGEKEAQCISIDHPDKLYVTNNFVVTHNTFCACSAISLLSRRFLIIVRPMYIDKWKSDLKAILGLEGHDVVVVQGSSQLMHLISTAKNDTLRAKAIIISNKTLQNWYSLYEKKGAYIDDQGYDCRPSELCSVLDVGVRLIDEVHQDFHLNFKIDLYTHVAHSISLSATLKGDDPFLNRMYEVAYPKDIRFAGMAYNRYVHAYSWIYRVKDPSQIRTAEWGSTVYSHHAFEKSIMRNRLLLNDYLDMIVKASIRFHFEQHQKGERLLIYCSSIQMCSMVVEHMRAEFKGIDVRRYVEDDPYENLMEADVCVSTLLSAGTGVDISMLTTVILTTAISSSQSNIQGFGRLRKIPDKRLQFVYFVCQDVPKHLEYHEKKKEMLKHMALQYDSVNYHHLLGA